jgi:hypothetical protein
MNLTLGDVVNDSVELTRTSLDLDKLADHSLFALTLEASSTVKCPLRDLLAL